MGEGQYRILEQPQLGPIIYVGLKGQVQEAACLCWRDSLVVHSIATMWRREAISQLTTIWPGGKGEGVLNLALTLLPVHSRSQESSWL